MEKDITDKDKTDNTNDQVNNEIEPNIEIEKDDNKIIFPKSMCGDENN